MHHKKVSQDTFLFIIYLKKMKSGDNIFEQEKPEDTSGYLLWQVSNLRQRKMNAALSEIDLTYPQFVILAGIFWLKQDHKTVNQILLIKFTKMDKSVVSSILKLLEKKKIVIRKTDIKDTRAKTLELSKTGITQLKKALEIIKQGDIEFFDITKQNIDNLNGILIKILKQNAY